LAASNCPGNWGLEGHAGPSLYRRRRQERIYKLPAASKRCSTRAWERQTVRPLRRRLAAKVNLHGRRRAAITATRGRKGMIDTVFRGRSVRRVHLAIDNAIVPRTRPPPAGDLQPKAILCQRSCLTEPRRRQHEDNWQYHWEPICGIARTPQRRRGFCERHASLQSVVLFPFSFGPSFHARTCFRTRRLCYSVVRSFLPDCLQS
jgi:hypothetical protein